VDALAAGAVLVVVFVGLAFSICIAAVTLGEQPAASQGWRELGDSGQRGCT